MIPFISIDFGTSSCAVAIIRDNTPLLVAPLTADAAGSQISPTTAFAPRDGAICACHLAELRKAEDPSRYFKEFKLDMRLDTHAHAGIPYVDIVTAILRNLKLAGEHALGAQQPLSHVLLTIPSIYHSTEDPRKEVMYHAARAAGFEHIEFLRESEAAAIYYDYLLPDSQQQGLSLIYDLGGGTFDHTLIEHRGGSYHLLGTGEPVIHVGGKYFTSKIIQRYTQHIGYSPAPDTRTRYAQQHAISAHCESLKRQLSTQPSARTPDGFEITREDFEHDIAPDIRRTIAACDQLLSSTGRCWADLDQVLLIGGSCAIPAIQRALSEHCRQQGSQAAIIWRERMRDHATFDPQFAVALGGALYGKTKFAPRPSIGYLQYVECGQLKNAPLSLDTNTLGRASEGSTLSIPIICTTPPERKMSRLHCQIAVTYDSHQNCYHYQLTDLGSANGTARNGDIIPYHTPQTLHSGDTITIGNHTLELYC